MLSPDNNANETIKAMKTQYSAFSKILVLCLGALVALQLTALGQTLVHRYSFTTDASDSVGGQHGTLMGGAICVDGQAVLDNAWGYDSSNPDGKYIDLPDGLIASYNSVTFEAWLTPFLGDMWSRIWDFGNGTTRYTFLSTGNNNQTGPESESLIPGRASNFLRSKNLMSDSSENHVVLTIDGPGRLAKLYLNGELVDLNPNFTNTPAALGSTTNNWLGRSQWGGDDYLVCWFNEFRVYNGPIDALRVKANYAAGPDTIPTPTVTNLVLLVRYPFYVGFPRPVELLAYAQGLTDPADVSDSTAVTYSVEDPSVLQISSVGVVTGLAPGTTKIIAQYGSLSATQTVQVIDQPYVLRHRYSFTTDASDSVGGQHGMLMGFAQIVGGQVVMDGSAGTYVELPPYLIAPTNVPHSAVTFEGWITPYPVNGAWTRLFDFGHTVGGVGGKDFFLAPNTEANGGQANLAVSDSTPGWRSEDEVFIPNILGRTNVHLVAIYNPNPNRARLALYLDGILAAETVTRKPLATLNNLVSYLGRSAYPADAYLNGAISEFRIWSGEMAPLHIAINGAIGPDAIGPTDPGALQQVRLVLSPNMVRGGVQSATVFADFALVTNVNVTRGLGTIYQSSNTNVVTVDTNGVLRAVGIGTVTITARYGSMSDSKLVSVAAPPLALKNRWSFNETSGTTATDSVGGKHGTLMGSAYFSGGGEVILDGSSGTYVELPPGIVTNYNQVTFETWVTVSSATPNNTAARLFVFGGTHDGNELGLVARTGGNNTYLRAFLLPTPMVPALRGGTIAIDKKVHVVGIFNDAGGRIDLYIDGALENSGFATFTLNALSNAFSRLGANIPLDQFTVCNFDEFRIYEGALTPYQIAINKAAGPGTVVLAPGTPVSVSLDVDPVMIQGMRRLAHVVANYSSVTNVRLRSDMEEVVLSSSNPNVVRVATGGWLEAVAPGGAIITVNVNGRTDSKQVLVAEKQTALLHRYSFDTDGSDLIGAQDAVLCGTASITGGKVELVNDSTYKANAYVELPPGMVSSFDAVTFEMWVDLGTQGNWARVIDFGDHTSGSSQNGISYIFLTRPWAATPTRLVFSDGVNQPSEVVLDAGGFSLEGFVGHIAAVLDARNNQMFIYSNGVMVASGAMNNKLLSGLRDVKCWIGRSLYAADAGLNGSIDEFRIYYGALSASDLAANYAAGPNTVRSSLLVVPPKPTMNIRLVGTQAIISWPVWAADFSLVSSPVLPATTWTPVSGPLTTNGTEIRMTVPITGTQQYFRLRK